MAWRALALIVALAPLASADAPKERPPVDEMTRDGLASLQGFWKLRSLTVAGTDLDMELFRTHRMVIAGDRLISEWDGKKFSEATIAITDTRRPWVLTVWGRGQNTIRAICRSDGDALTICFSEKGEKLPTEFASRRGTSLALQVWQRQKK
jgi:uncharacterized protein (TIGR03067 family)